MAHSIKKYIVKYGFLILFSIASVWNFNVFSQANVLKAKSESEKKYFYRDSIVSQIEWYNSKKKLDSLKTYYKTGELNEVFYFNKGKYHGESYKLNKKGEKVTTWIFEKGRLLKREDLILEYNKKDEQKIKDIHTKLKTVLANLKNTPNNLKHLSQLASIRQKLGNYTLALNDLNNIEDDINNIALRKKKMVPKKFSANIYDRKGNIYSYLEMDDKAIYFLEKAVKATPDDTRIMYNLGIHLYSIKSYNRAKLYLDKVVALKPTHSFANFSLSAYYIDHENYEKAKYHNDIALINEKSLLKYSNKELENDLRTQRGLIFYHLGESETAINILKEVILMNETNSFAHKNLGMVYYHLKEYNLACEYLEKAKNLGYIEKHDRNDLQEFLKISCNNGN